MAEGSGLAVLGGAVCEPGRCTEGRVIAFGYGTGRRTHDEHNASIAACIRWHRAQAEPKAAVAPGVRSWMPCPICAA